MTEIEVRANLNFDNYRQGWFYRGVAEDRWTRALILAGYFTVTDVMEVTDGPAVDRDRITRGVPDIDMDLGVGGPEEADPRESEAEEG